MSLLSAVTMPTGVVRRTPRDARPIRFKAIWVSLPIPLEPFHVSSAAYSMVPPTMACWRLRAGAGGAPNLVTSRRILASAARALFIGLQRLSLKVRAEPRHTPNHLVASLAKGTLLPSTRTPMSVGRMLGLTPSAGIWCVDHSVYPFS